MSQAHTGKILSAETIEKIRLLNNIKPTSESIKKMQETKKLQAKDPAYRDAFASNFGEFIKPKVDYETACKITKLREDGLSYNKIGKITGIVGGTVRRVCLGLGPYRDIVNCEKSL